MKLLASLLRFLAFFLQHLPCKHQVVLMSRQSSKMSLDYAYLKQELEKRLGEGSVELCLTEPETKSKLAFIAGTFRQLVMACTTKVIVADGYNPAICIPKTRKGSTVIQIWHALGAVKKFGYQAIDTPAGRSSSSAEAARMHKNYDIIVSAGPGAIPAYSEAFGYSAGSIVPIGLPRIDYLLDPDPRSRRRTSCADIVSANPVLTNGKKNIVYAPTLRKGEGYENWIDKYLTALASNCPASEANLIFTGHPLDRDAGAGIEDKFDCLHIIPDVSTIDLLEIADCVITDYSAICFEAGLLNCDTCFYVPDIDRYATSPGLNVDLLGGQAGFASADAAEVMSVALGDNPEAQEHFATFRRFAEDYFEGISFGCTQRMADLVEKTLAGK